MPSLYSGDKSKESLGASVAKKMCFQRSTKRIEGESRPPKPWWKVITQSRTGSRETPVAELVVCSWHDQLPDVVGMRPQRATTSIREKMTEPLLFDERGPLIMNNCVVTLIFDFNIDKLKWCIHRVTVSQ